ARCIGLGLLIVRHFRQRHGQGLGVALTQHRELDRRTGRHAADPLGEVARILDRSVVHRGDDIAAPNAGLRRRTAVLRLVDDRTRAVLHAEAAGDVGVHGLDLHADPATLDEALVLELRDHGLDRVGRNAEANADRATGRRDDRGVDGDHLAVGVERRSAGVALVDRRVDLDEVVIRTGAYVAAARRYDA